MEIDNKGINYVQLPQVDLWLSSSEFSCLEFAESDLLSLDALKF